MTGNETDNVMNDRPNLPFPAACSNDLGDLESAIQALKEHIHSYQIAGFTQISSWLE